MTWSASQFKRATSAGPEISSGYEYRGLGLWKCSPRSWYLIHLNTGHMIAEIKGAVAVAFPVATEIAEAGDWNFTGLLGWKNSDPELATRVLSIIAKNKNASRKRYGGISDENVAKQIAVARMN